MTWYKNADVEMMWNTKPKSTNDACELLMGNQCMSNVGIVLADKV